MEGSINPVTSEEDWQRFLAGLPVWRAPLRPLVLVSPHPDDETLGAGCLIADQRSLRLPVTVVAVTDGEAAYPHADLAAMRREEQRAALAVLGVEAARTIRLGLPDGGVADYEKELRRALLPLVHSRTLLAAPWRFDAHPDHEACGRVAECVAREMGAVLVTYFFWTWHKHAPDFVAGLPLHRWFGAEEALRRRSEAVVLYKSQIEATGSVVPLPPVLLKPALRNFETFAIRDFGRGR